MAEYNNMYVYHEARDGQYGLKSYWTSSQTVEFDDGQNLEEYKTELSQDVDAKGDTIGYSLDDGEVFLYSDDNKIATETMQIKTTPNITLDDISNLSIRLSKGKIRFTWRDPSDVVFSELPLITWAGTKVIRKIGSAPNDVTDGTLVIDSKDRDTYSSTPYFDEPSTNNVYYYYRFFPYDTNGNYYGRTCGVIYKPIRLIPVDPPQLTETYTYTGQNITPNFTNYDTNFMTRGGTVYAKNAGDYSTTFTLKEGYKWSDDTIEPKTINWGIGKAEGFVNLSKTIVTMIEGSDTINIIDSSGNISRVYSSNESVCTVNYSNDIITVNYVSIGNAIVNIQVDESQNYSGNVKTINVVCQEDTRKIHILGGTNTNAIRGNYVYNGTSWINDSPLTFDFDMGGIAILNNEIHVFGGYPNYTNHHKLVNDEWVTDVNCPKFSWNNWRNSAVVYNDEIHILARETSYESMDHYKFDGTNWISVSTVPSDIKYYHTLACANNILYLFGNTRNSGSTGDAKLYKYNNGWELISTPEWGLNTSPTDGCYCFEYNKTLHVATGYPGYIYKYENGIWTTVTAIPTGFRINQNAMFVVQNNKINMISYYGNKIGHYCYNGSTWDLISKPKYSTDRSCAIVY